MCIRAAESPCCTAETNNVVKQLHSNNKTPVYSSHHPCYGLNVSVPPKFTLTSNAMVLGGRASGPSLGHENEDFMVGLTA